MQFNLGDFFYNLYPGTFFLIFWYMKVPFIKDNLDKILNLNNNNLFQAIVLIITALFLGTILHGIWRTGKYILAKKYKKDEDRNEFYRKNAVIWGRNLRALPEFFSSRAALWGSTIVGLVISIIFKINLDYIWVYFILIIIFYLLYHFDNEKEEKTVERMYDCLRKKDIPD